MNKPHLQKCSITCQKLFGMIKSSLGIMENWNLNHQNRKFTLKFSIWYSKFDNEQELSWNHRYPLNDYLRTIPNSTSLTVEFAHWPCGDSQVSSQQLFEPCQRLHRSTLLQPILQAILQKKYHWVSERLNWKLPSPNYTDKSFVRQTAMMLHDNISMKTRKTQSRCIGRLNLGVLWTETHTQDA